MTSLYCAILVAGFMATASLADIDADIDPQRMQRDIRIMEGVLANLYHDAPDQANFHTRGLHFDGYGVLFLAAEPRLMEEIRDNSLSRRKWTGFKPRPARRISRQLRRHHRSTRQRRPDNGLLPA